MDTEFFYVAPMKVIYPGVFPVQSRGDAI